MPSTAEKLFNTYRQELLIIREMEALLASKENSGAPRGIPGRPPAPPETFSNNAYAAHQQQEEGCEQVLQTHKTVLSYMEQEMQPYLQIISKPLMMRVISGYYLQGMTNEEVAAAIPTSVRYLYKIKRSFFEMCSRFSS